MCSKKIGDLPSEGEDVSFRHVNLVELLRLRCSVFHLENWKNKNITSPNYFQDWYEDIKRQYK